MSDIWWGVFAIGFVVLFFTWVIGIAVKHSRRKAGEVQQIERLMESCPPVITALAAFARRRNSILVTLAGLSETDTEEIRPFDLLLEDLIYLIRRVHFLHTLRSGNSEGEPKLSKKDAEVILAYYAACGDRQLAGLDWIELLTRIGISKSKNPTLFSQHPSSVVPSGSSFAISMSTLLD